MLDAALVMADGGARLCGRTALCFGYTWTLGCAQLPSTPSAPCPGKLLFNLQVGQELSCPLLSAMVLRVLSGTKDTPASMTSTSSEGGSLCAHVSQGKVYAMSQAGRNSE